MFFVKKYLVGIILWNNMTIKIKNNRYARKKNTDMLDQIVERHECDMWLGKIKALMDTYETNNTIENEHECGSFLIIAWIIFIFVFGFGFYLLIRLFYSLA